MGDWPHRLAATPDHPVTPPPNKQTETSRQSPKQAQSFTLTFFEALH